MKFYVQYFPITKSFGRIANPDNISLDSFCEQVRVTDEFCQSIVMSVFANSIRDVENDVNNYFKTISQSVSAQKFQLEQENNILDGCKHLVMK